MSRKSFVTWFLVVNENWSSRVTGGWVVALVWFACAVIMDRPVPQSVNICLAFGFLIWVGYLVWEEADNRASRFENELAARQNNDTGQLPDGMSKPTAVSSTGISRIYASLTRFVVILLTLVFATMYVAFSAKVAAAHPKSGDQKGTGDHTNPPTETPKPNIVGNWVGSYVCSKHGGTLEWKITTDEQGEIDVDETYHAKLPLIGESSGKNTYTGKWEGQVLNLETTSLGGYHIKLTSDTSKRTLSGSYYGKPGCTAVTLHRK